MHLTRFQLSDFRSWARLELPLEPGLTLISGPNAAGKSNLIEALYLLAALRSTRAAVEGELIRWQAESPQTMRTAATAVTREGEVEVEVSVSARPGTEGGGARSRTGAPLTSKRIRVNGVPRRAADALGAIRAVQFTTLDLELLTGPSALRRRYLDVAIGQLRPGYAAELSRYQRVLQQRNALLKRIAAHQASLSELVQWDHLMAAAAAPIWASRTEATATLSQSAAARHEGLRSSADASEQLSLGYVPALEHGGAIDQWEAAMRETLRQGRTRDLARGATQTGPHRDDLAIDLDGRPAAAFGSRAQQRACALALRLAEADFIQASSGEAAILLLDDIFSELDTERAECVGAALADVEQVVLTTAQAGTMPQSLPTPAAAWRIAGGTLEPA